MVQPVPLHGRVEGRMVDMRRWRMRALSPTGPGGASVTHGEAMELVTLVDADEPDKKKLITTVRHVNACLGGAEGMDSVSAAQSWDKRQAERLWDDDGPDDPPAVVAA